MTVKKILVDTEFLTDETSKPNHNQYWDFQLPMASNANSSAMGSKESFD